MEFTGDKHLFDIIELAILSAKLDPLDYLTQGHMTTEEIIEYEISRIFGNASDVVIAGYKQELFVDCHRRLNTWYDLNKNNDNDAPALHQMVLDLVNVDDCGILGCMLVDENEPANRTKRKIYIYKDAFTKFFDVVVKPGIFNSGIPEADIMLIWNTIRAFYLRDVLYHEYRHYCQPNVRFTDERFSIANEHDACTYAHVRLLEDLNLNKLK